MGKVYYVKVVEQWIMSIFLELSIMINCCNGLDYKISRIVQNLNILEWSKITIFLIRV